MNQRAIILEGRLPIPGLSENREIHKIPDSPRVYAQDGSTYAGFRQLVAFGFSRNHSNAKRGNLN